MSETRARSAGEIPVREYARRRAGYHARRVISSTIRGTVDLTRRSLPYIGAIALVRGVGGGILDASDQAINIGREAYGIEVAVGFGDREKISPELLAKKGITPDDKYDAFGTLAISISGAERQGDIFVTTPVATPQD